MEILSHYAVAFLLRWIHILVGVTWIGLLYYFNFVQGEYFKEADGGAKSDAIQKLVPRALWWFRWGAMFTFLSGVLLLGVFHKVIGLGIVVGATLGTIMFLNVWPRPLFSLTRMIGAWTHGSTLFYLGLLFVVAVCLSYAVRLSALTLQVKNLAQEVSLLRERIGEGSASASEPKTGGSPANPRTFGPAWSRRHRRPCPS